MWVWPNFSLFFTLLASFLLRSKNVNVFANVFAVCAVMESVILSVSLATLRKQRFNYNHQNTISLLKLRDVSRFSLVWVVWFFKVFIRSPCFIFSPTILYISAAFSTFTFYGVLLHVPSSNSATLHWKPRLAFSSPKSSHDDVCMKGMSMVLIGSFLLSDWLVQPGAGRQRRPISDRESEACSSLTRKPAPSVKAINRFVQQWEVYVTQGSRICLLSQATCVVEYRWHTAEIINFILKLSFVFLKKISRQIKSYQGARGTSLDSLSVRRYARSFVLTRCCILTWVGKFWCGPC